jgi:class 3 adenylate cyclase
MHCSQCGADNREAANFCDSCGASLAAEAPATIGKGARPESKTGERRHLTVLFCDLVNSTSIATHLDPEEWREVVASYHRAATEAITRFAGHVAQYLGDGVMAYFGWPEAHENAAESAARAGLAILEQIEQLNRQSGHGKLSVRVGMDSGAVVIGAGAGKDTDVFGDVPNIAARTQAAAEPDSVVITAATERLISGLFVVQSRGAQSIKGIEHPVQLYQLIRPSTARGRLEASAAARGLTRFVGREQELGFLRDCWESAITGEGRAVLIIGEAGIGKSRLVQEFRHHVAGTPHVWAEAAASRFFQNTPFYGVADMVRALQQGYGSSLSRVGEAVVQQRSRRRTDRAVAPTTNDQSTPGVFPRTEKEPTRLKSSLDFELEPPPIAQLFLAGRLRSQRPNLRPQTSGIVCCLPWLNGCWLQPESCRPQWRSRTCIGPIRLLWS